MALYACPKLLLDNQSSEKSDIWALALTISDELFSDAKESFFEQNRKSECNRRAKPKLKYKIFLKIGDE